MKTQVKDIIREIVGNDTSMSEPRRLLVTEGMSFNGGKIEHLAEEVHVTASCTFVVGQRKWAHDGDKWVRMDETATGISDNEGSLRFGNCYLVFPKFPAPCDYVRLVTLGQPHLELAYWHYNEWGEEPQEVMGAFIGALCEQAT